MAPVAAATATEPEVDYQPMKSFLEKTSPPPTPPKVFITLTPTEGPMSLERKAIETAAEACFTSDLMRSPDADVTMTLETRADGTISNGTVDGTSEAVGSCLVGRLAKVPLHEEGKPQHIVVVLTISVS